jgi:hypothetical protein
MWPDRVVAYGQQRRWCVNNINFVCEKKKKKQYVCCQHAASRFIYVQGH